MGAATTGVGVATCLGLAGSLSPIVLSSIQRVLYLSTLTERSLANESNGRGVAEGALDYGLHINKYYNI